MMNQAFSSSDEDSEGEFYGSDGRDYFSEEDKVIKASEEEEDDSEDEVVDETPPHENCSTEKGIS